MNAVADYSLGAAYLAGEVSAHRAVTSWISSVVCRFSNLRNSKDDAFQETHLKVFANLSAGLVNVPLRRYVLTVSKQTCHEILRRETYPEVPMDPRDLENICEDTYDSTEAVEREGRLEALAEAVDALPPRSREVLRLRMVGLAYQEIAEELGINHDAAKKIGQYGQTLIQMRDVPVTS